MVLFLVIDRCRLITTSKKRELPVLWRARTKISKIKFNTDSEAVTGVLGMHPAYRPVVFD